MTTDRTSTEFDCPSCGPGAQYGLVGDRYQCRGLAGDGCDERFSVPQDDMWKHMVSVRVRRSPPPSERPNEAFVALIVEALRGLDQERRSDVMSEVHKAFCEHCWVELEPGGRCYCHSSYDE